MTRFQMEIEFDLVAIAKDVLGDDNAIKEIEERLPSLTVEFDVEAESHEEIYVSEIVYLDRLRMTFSLLPIGALNRVLVWDEFMTALGNYLKKDADDDAYKAYVDLVGGARELFYDDLRDRVKRD